MIYAGVDIAKVDHVIGAVDERGSEACGPMGFKNGAAGFERCEAWLEGVAAPPADVPVGMEATGHYWMALYAFLTSRGYAVAVIDPLQVRAVRRFKGLGGVKNDRVDAGLIAEAMRIGRYDPTRLATDDARSLRTLTRYHQSLKSELAEVKVQCTCLLDACFPEFSGVFSDMFGAAGRAVLSRSPLPSEVRRRRVDSPRRDISSAARGSRRVDGKAAEIKELAGRSVGIALGERAASLQVRSLVRQMDFLDAECAKIEAEARGLLDRVEPLVLTIPGGVLHDRRPDRRRDRRRLQVPQRLRPGGLRGPQLAGVPVGHVRQRRRAHHQARIAVPAPRALAGREPGAPARPVPARVLREEARRGEVPPRGGDGGRQEAVPHSLRRDARPGPVRPLEAGEGPVKAFGIRFSRCSEIQN